VLLLQPGRQQVGVGERCLLLLLLHGGRCRRRRLLLLLRCVAGLLAGSPLHGAGLL
jgi:hypothetical protein